MKRLASILGIAAGALVLAIAVGLFATEDTAEACTVVAGETHWECRDGKWVNPDGTDWVNACDRTPQGSHCVDGRDTGSPRTRALGRLVEVFPIPITEAKPGAIMSTDPARLGRWDPIYDTEETSVPYCKGQTDHGGSCVQQELPVVDSEPRPLADPGEVLYTADDDNRSVRSNSGTCHREWHDGTRWHRSLSYGGSDSACLRAAWDAHRISEDQEPVGRNEALPEGDPPAAPGTETRLPEPPTPFTYYADENNRAVRGIDNTCYRQQRINGEWRRSTHYLSTDYLEACRLASWNAYKRSQGESLIPLTDEFPKGWPPNSGDEPQAGSDQWPHATPTPAPGDGG